MIREDATFSHQTEGETQHPDHLGSPKAGSFFSSAFERAELGPLVKVEGGAASPKSPHESIRLDS
jgi:hypothetical protein